MEIGVFLYGVIIGSFLGMLSYRLPLRISLYSPKRSFCPKCNSNIKWYDNIPIISYILLRGRCRDCKNSIDKRYFFIELFSGIISVVAFVKYGFCTEFFVVSSIFYILLLLSFIDLEYMAVPDYLLLLVLVLALWYGDFINGLIFLGIGFLLQFVVTFYIQNIKSKLLKDKALEEQYALGEGDIPIFGVIGALVGLKLGLVAIFFSAIFAIFPAFYNIIVKKDIQTPFIPFLSLGLFVCVFFEQAILEYI